VGGATATRPWRRLCPSPGTNTNGAAPREAVAGGGPLAQRSGAGRSADASLSLPICGVRAVLEVVRAGRHQGGLQLSDHSGSVLVGCSKRESRVGPHRASTSPPSGAKSDWHTQPLVPRTRPHHCCRSFTHQSSLPALDQVAFGRYPCLQSFPSRPKLSEPLRPDSAIGNSFCA
jgi:hypothetical protein